MAVRKKNSLRIIGGAWRSRRIRFAGAPQVRPTPDRVRETLFNWLADRVTGAFCLDLFAGSGALGFEAASRGAARVVMVDHDAPVAAVLAEQKRVLAAAQVEIVQEDAMRYVGHTEQAFDIVFLDPPFGTGLLQQALPVIVARRLIRATGLVYIESPVQAVSPCLEPLSRVRVKTAGQVRHELYSLEP